MTQMQSRKKNSFLAPPTSVEAIFQNIPFAMLQN